MAAIVMLYSGCGLREAITFLKYADYLVGDSVVLISPQSGL